MRAYWRVALLIWLASACGSRGEAKTPEGAVRILIAAARAGDRATVYRRLGPATRARLDTLASAARRMSGRVAMKPEDFLSVGWAPPAWEAAGTRTLRRDGDRAEVVVYSSTGDRQAVPLVREGGEWKIELP